MYSRIPVINAGDGGHNHPTQTMIDLLTIRQRKGHLDHLKIGFCGDLKFGRTVHSLVNSLVRYPGNEFYFISPEELKVPEYLIEDTLKPAKAPYHEVSSLEETLPELDVLYMTRVQKERFFNEEDYIRLKDIYILDQEKLNLAKADMPVLHPLPRVDEIAPEVDADPRAAYFQQERRCFYVKRRIHSEWCCDRSYSRGKGNGHLQIAGIGIQDAVCSIAAIGEKPEIRLQGSDQD